MKKQNRKKIIIPVIIVIAIVIIAIVAYTLRSTPKSESENTTTEATESDSTSEDTASEEEIQTEEAVIEESDEEEFATDSTTAAERESDEADELFKICLAYIEEYELDSDDFQVKEALMVQDLSNDYLYFQCTHDDTTEYACYTYDGYYFRDDISQKTLKSEYEAALVTMENDEDEYNVYYEYSKEDIEQVNDMF